MHGVAATDGACLWLTGRRGSGKTTVAGLVAAELARRGQAVAVLDQPDVERHLDATDRLGALVWVVALLTGAGSVTLVAVDDLGRAARERARHAIPGFVEVHVDGGDGPDRYEEPYAAELRVPTHDRVAEASAAQVVSWLEDRGLVGADGSAD